MIKAIVSDFSGVVSGYDGSTNQELLEWFRAQQPKYTTALFSASKRLAAQPQLQTKLLETFDTVFLTGAAQLDKSTVAAYHWLAQQLNCSPAEIIYLDDNHHNVTAAQRLGIHAFHFFDNTQFWRELAKAQLLELV